VQALITADRMTRWFVALCLAGGVIAIIATLDYGAYPYALERYWIYEYLLRTQDVSGGVLLLALALAACLRPGRELALAFADAIGRRPFLAAAALFVALCLGAIFIEHAHPLAQDEYAALFQSKAFAAGRLTGEFPPQFLGRLIPPDYMNQFLYGSFQTGQVASAYWPGFATILAPFSALGAPWACNAFLAALALLLMGRLAEQLTGQREARGWAMLLALASPAFTGMAITYFSMTAHLLLNLVFASLLMEGRTPARLAAAGFVGSIALLLHNPFPHSLFALPWIGWLALQPGRYRNLLALAAGYAPLALAVGFGWALLLSDIQGPAPYALYPFDDNRLHRLANFFWSWHIRARTALPGPGEEVLAMRLADLSRLWNWAVPGMPLLAAAGWWLGRRDARVVLLGLSMLCTIAGFLFIGYTQGHGWGARYLHSAWGVLPVLAAAALTRVTEPRRINSLAAYVASLAVLSLLFATALRAWQIDSYVSMQLANRPPTAAAERQVVFVAFDRRRYTADLVQNDPFLRDPVWYMLSYGRQSDIDLMRSHFPEAKLIREDRRGQVWTRP
jgi:hypothetical protein